MGQRQMICRVDGEQMGVSMYLVVEDGNYHHGFRRNLLDRVQVADGIHCRDASVLPLARRFLPLSRDSGPELGHPVLAPRPDEILVVAALGVARRVERNSGVQLGGRGVAGEGVVRRLLLLLSPRLAAGSLKRSRIGNDAFHALRTRAGH